jgi:hypothetical protein
VLSDLITATTIEALPGRTADDRRRRVAVFKEVVQPLLERSVRVMGILLKQSRELVVLCCNVSEDECRKEEEAVRALAEAVKLVEEKSVGAEWERAQAEWKALVEGMQSAAT